MNAERFLCNRILNTFLVFLSILFVFLLDVPIADCCTTDADCDDLDACTTDSCRYNSAALFFDGASSVECGTDSSISDFGTSDRTIEGWFKPDTITSGFPGIFHIGRKGTNPQVAVFLFNGDLAVGIEDTQISKALGPYLKRAMMEDGTYMNVIMLKPHRQDKMQRARAIQARMRAGMVKFDKNADWWLTFEDECMSFPRARHDDTVDALAYQGILIDSMSEGLTDEELEDEAYEEEYRESGMSEQGRSEITGY